MKFKDFQEISIIHYLLMSANPRIIMNKGSRLGDTVLVVLGGARVPQLLFVRVLLRSTL